MTGKATFFNARRGIRRPATPSLAFAGAAGLPEPVSRGRIGTKSQAIRRMWVYTAHFRDAGFCELKGWKYA